ncbi:DUF3490 domain-containing protein, partial [Acinetobacter baumannii]
MESPLPPSEKDQEFLSSALKNDDEMKEATVSGRVLEEDQELISTSLKEDMRGLTLPPRDKDKELTSIHILDMPSLEKISSTRDPVKDSPATRSLKFAKSRSCHASIFSGSASPWYLMTDYSENTSSFGSERESVGFERKISPFVSNKQSLSRKSSPFSPENALDVEIDTLNVKSSPPEDVISSNDETKERAELPTEQEMVKSPAKENEPKVNESPKKDVKDIGLDPIEDEYRGLSSWPVEFKRLQREIVEHWHACHVSLVHRTYFFLLFQGDPSDAIYLEVELRRMKFLKENF